MAAEKPYREWTATDVEEYLAGIASQPCHLPSTELAKVATRLRAVSGFIWATGPAGPRARIAGTGIDVFEVIRDYIDVERDRQALAAVYDWLTSEQLAAAVAYYEAYPEEIDQRLALDEAVARAFDRHAHA